MTVDLSWAGWTAWILKRSWVAILLVTLLAFLGGLTIPLYQNIAPDYRSPLKVDALPNTGENQQVILTEWAGRSPRDVEDQITFPLTSALLSVPKVKTIRSSSVFGASNVYVIFEDGVDAYWARSRILEKLSSLPSNLMPEGVSPQLGPDATGLGQIFWYTLEGQDPAGKTVGGWDPDELRSIQDWTVRFALQSVPGVSEVASVGGFVKEIHVDLNPDALSAAQLSLEEVADAIRSSNRDVGVRTLEINQVEYLVRGLGRIQSIEDLENTVVVARNHTPVRIKDVGRVTVGPRLRRGALDDAGAPAVGAVVVARFDANPVEVIQGVRAKIRDIQPSLPRRTLEDGTLSQVTLVPFYDRTELIEETLTTLSSALSQQLAITLVVVLLLLNTLRGAILIAILPPLGVLVTFLLMRALRVEVNIMALGGIAIAIGSMVDIGVIFIENIHRHLRNTPHGPRTMPVVRAMSEVAPAVTTSVLTTVVGFLPVVGLGTAELKLFGPLALTKSAAMLAALAIALVLLPPAAYLALRTSQGEGSSPHRRALALTAGFMVFGFLIWWGGFLSVAAIAAASIFLLGLRGFEKMYPILLAQALAHRRCFLLGPILILLIGLTSGLGASPLLGLLPSSSPAADWIRASLPGLPRGYMPSFDEGSFLYMPSTMPHASIGEVQRMLSTLDAAIAQVPEVHRVVGKLGRVQSALDPAPISMIETMVSYRPKYILEEGVRVRQWRDHIRSKEDIWGAIVEAAQQLGLTTPPILMPIETRLLMLQTGIRAPLGLRIQGPTVDAAQTFAMKLEPILKAGISINPDTVFTDRALAKPYLEVVFDRRAIGRYGLRIQDVQTALQYAVGGVELTQLIDGRERTPIRLRYMREQRDSLEALHRVRVTGSDGEQIPLSLVAKIRYRPGAQIIRTEDTFATSYLQFASAEHRSPGQAVKEAQKLIQSALERGTVTMPPDVRYEFVGTYQNQQRSERRLMFLIPLALLIICTLLYMQFESWELTLFVSSGVLVTVAGSLLVLSLYAQPWFLNFEVGGASVRALFNVRPVAVTVATWIGMIALAGIATDDGVVLGTYLQESFRRVQPDTKAAIRQCTIEGAARRVRPCLITTATTLLALLPVVIGEGRGSDVMQALALPVFGGMLFEILTLFLVPTLFCAAQERALERNPS